MLRPSTPAPPSDYQVEIKSSTGCRTLRFRQGETCVIAGPNGAGKSAIMAELFAALLGSRPALSPESASLDLLRAGLGVLLQSKAPIIEPTESIEANLACAASIATSGRTAQQRVERALNELNLLDWRKRPFDGLPRSIQQKTSLSLILVAEPAFLILDEPTEFLDLQTESSVHVWLRQLVRENGANVVIATRNASVARALCQHAILMRAGEIILDQAIEDLPGMIQGDFYQFRLQAELDSGRSLWFGGLALIADQNETLLLTVMEDQAALHGLLGRIRDLSIPILSVEKVTPSLDILFTHLMHAPVEELGLKVGSSGAKETFLD